MNMSAKEQNLLRQDVERLHGKDAAYDNASTIDAVKLLVAALLIALAFRLFVFDVVRINGPSMEPTFFNNHRVFAEKVSYCFREPRRGEIVIAHYPPEVENDSVIKRVVGLPGETVSVRDGLLFIDGQPLNESVYWTELINMSMDDVKIPEKSVFLVGDNRNYSLDSRSSMVGPVPYYRVVARVLLQVWPADQIRKFQPVAYD